jgi:hypothetical protein
MVDEVKDDLSNIKFSFNDKILLVILIANGFSVLISIFLTYIFSNSIITTLCAISIGVTIGIMINYFILTRYNLIKTKNIGFIQKNIENEIEEFQTIMK